MTTRILHILILFLAIQVTNVGYAQKNTKWDREKIKGTRNLPYAPYDGYPFLTNSWMLGKIEFASGVKDDSIYLRYSSFKDELVYFNKTISTQIIIDKATLKGFSFIDGDGRTRIFRNQYYDGYMKGDRYFEILSDGEIKLLVYRKVSLSTITPYKDESGILTNLAYTNDYQFYFYSPEKGYISVRPNWLSLNAKFNKTDQKPIKKLLRKNKIRIDSEENFVRAWKLIEKEGYKVIL